MINVEPVLFEKSQQSGAAFRRQLHRKTGGRSDGRNDGNARHRRFLYQFKTRPSAQKQDMSVQREQAVHQCPAGQLVEGIVPPYVFAQKNKVALHGKKPGGMNAAGGSKAALGRLQFPWELV